jgi:hypothetical protein
MPIIAKNEGKDFEKIPTGMHQAVCAFVEDIGTHEGSYMGHTISNHQVIVCWELKELMKEGENAGRPFMISKFYTLSLYEKANLRKDLESWRGKEFTDDELKGFDIENLIGANCFLNIIEKEKKDGSVRAQIASINPIPSGMEKLFVVNKIPPEWIDKKRSQSIEALAETTGESAGPDDDLPF